MAILSGKPTSLTRNVASSDITLDINGAITAFGLGSDPDWNDPTGIQNVIFIYKDATGHQTHQLVFGQSRVGKLRVSAHAKQNTWKVSSVVFVDYDGATKTIHRSDFPTPDEFDIVVGDGSQSGGGGTDTGGGGTTTTNPFTHLRDAVVEGANLRRVGNQTGWCGPNFTDLVVASGDAFIEAKMGWMTGFAYIGFGAVSNKPDDALTAAQLTDTNISPYHWGDYAIVVQEGAQVSFIAGNIGWIQHPWQILDPNVLHTYRVELSGGVFKAYVDGVLVHTSTPNFPPVNYPVTPVASFSQADVMQDVSVGLING